MVARVFIAIEHGKEVLPTALEVEKQLSADYAEKLQIDGTIILGPFALEDGWFDEDSGMKYYPPTTITSVAKNNVYSHNYRKDSITPPGDYLSEIIFRVGAYSRGFNQRRGLKVGD